MNKKYVIPIIIIVSFLLIFPLLFLNNARAQFDKIELLPILNPSLQPVLSLSDKQMNELRIKYIEELELASKTHVDSILGKMSLAAETDPYIVAEVNDYVVSLIPSLQKHYGYTYFEELKCIGLYPEADLLAGVIAIKKTVGYGGNLCEAGLYEYVTFWIDWNNDDKYTNDELIGTSEINVHDIANEDRCLNCQNSPIYYALSLKIPKPKRKICNTPNLVHVRAILSFGMPHLNPNTNPYFGNIIDRWVQIKPAKYHILKPIDMYPIEWEKYVIGLKPIELLPKQYELFEVKDPILYSIDPIPPEPPLPYVTHIVYPEEAEKVEDIVISPDDLKELYADKDIEEERIEYASIIAELSNKKITRYEGSIRLKDEIALSTTNLLQVELVNPAKIITADLIKIYPGLKLGNTNYEELKCFGMDTPNDRMVGIIHIKRPAGYKGNLCSKGSTEYVRFWIDWDCDGFDSADDIGFTSIKVHDITTIPDEGLYYAVYHKFVPNYRRNCNDTNVYRARAILSWNVCPGPNPTWKYHWGNIIDRCVQIKPDEEYGGIWPIIDTIGGMNKIDIDPNGYANGFPADSTPIRRIDAPFGCTVTISGYIINVPDFSESNNTNIYYSPDVRYKFQYKNEESTWWSDMQPAHTEKFWISVKKYDTQAIPPEIITKGLWNKADADGFYKYYEDLKGTIIQRVSLNTLMPWNTRGLPDGRYTIRMVVKSGVDLIYSDSFGETITVVLDNTSPYAKITLDPSIGVCGKVTIGIPITGEYTALDQHILKYRLKYTCGASCLTPTGFIKRGEYNVFSGCITGTKCVKETTYNPPGSTLLPPASGPFPSDYQPTSPTYQLLGKNEGAFSQDTTGFVSCGYSINLTVWDRTICNNSYGNRWRHTSEYFCLLEGQPPICTAVCEEGQMRPCATACGTGIETYHNGQWINCTAPTPANEVCDGIDNDCDGQIDEGLMNNYFADNDGDGYGNASDSVQACSSPSGYVSNSDDCDDMDPNIHPQAVEIQCNGVDDDCIGGDECDSYGGNEFGQLHIAESHGNLGDEIQIPVIIQGASNMVQALGFNILYDSSILEYSGFERGDLTASFDFIDVNPLGAGVLKVGGFSANSNIPAGSNGSLILLNFLVQDGYEDECYPLSPDGLLDDIVDFTSSGACFYIRSCNGDINQDGSVSPKDALLVLGCYLGISSCSECMDVNNDGSVTPSDALCIFKKYLGFPSCLD